MHNDPLKYYFEGPRANLKELQSSIGKKKIGRSNDIRLALNCAQSMYHTHEHFFQLIDKIKTTFPNSKEYEKAIMSLYPQFQLVKDLANCSKHHRLDNSNKRITNASQIEEYMIMTEYEDSQGMFYNARKVITATCDNGEEIDVFGLLEFTDYFWKSELYYYNLLKEKPIQNKKKSHIPKRESDSGAAKLDIEQTGGTEFNMKMKFFKKTNGS